MAKSIFSKEKFLVLDGGMGTMLQAAGLPAGEPAESMLFSAPQKLVEIHRRYIDAGAEMICACTFSANAKKLAGFGHSLQEVVDAAFRCAKEAARGTDTLVALDIGPLGEMLEPAGLLSAEQAYQLFSEVVLAGQAAGADAILIETMADLAEAKAALLAARENSDLPVLISMTFEPDGRTFSGVQVEAMAAALGGLGAAALGINCSLGPSQIMPLAARLANSTPLPVFIKPNAGLPDPATGAYHLSAREFAEQMLPCLNLGVQGVGGCCGTTPESIRELVALFADKKPAPSRYVAASRVSSGTHYLPINACCVVGERINPTGKKRLQESLKSGDLAYLQSLAVAQQESGAQILDINVGAPGVDEVQLLPQAVRAVQAVCQLPLMLDSANPKALEAALRICIGKPIINSTSAEEEKLAAILPLAKKYSAAIVGLTLDENGIPDSAEQRFALAEKILSRALACGIPREDVFIDCLTLAVSAEPAAAQSTLKALSQVHHQLGLKTLLGVSNVSFGLPNRGLVNRSFLAAALAAGLALPILNPADREMMDTVFAHRLLAGQDEQAKAYVSRFAEAAAQAAATPSQEELQLDQAIEKGLAAQAGQIAAALLAQKAEGLQLVEDFLVPALDRVGQGFEQGRLFLPQLLAAANAAQAAFEQIRSSMTGAAEQGPPIVIATVQGDVHDIGKNIVRVLLENYNFRVIDLGRDVAPQAVVAAAKESGAQLVGLSALMTTTLPAMEATIIALKQAALSCKVVVGGAVLTADYAEKIGADFYAKDAMQTVEIARTLHAQ